MLDNPIWSALTTRHARFAVGGERLKRYPADVAPFVATDDTGGVAADALSALTEPGETLYLVGEPPALPPGWEVERRPPVLQMVCGGRIDASTDEGASAILGPGDVPEMLGLTSLVFPGYFRPGTVGLGTYLGVRDSGRLVAMAGLRLALDGFSEISGICTHPDHRGRGHARRLVARLVDEVFGEGRTPFLHVDSGNVGARLAYEKLGFLPRRELPLTRITRPRS